MSRSFTTFGDGSSASASFTGWSIFFWFVVFALLFLGAVFWISDRSEVCVSSMLVEADGTTVTNPVTCR